MEKNVKWVSNANTGNIFTVGLYNSIYFPKFFDNNYGSEIYREQRKAKQSHTKENFIFNLTGVVNGSFFCLPLL